MPHFYYSPDFLQHETGSHPENAGRLRAVVEHLETTGLAAKCTTGEFAPAGEATIGRVHEADHLEGLDALAARGGGRADADTVVCPRSVDIARLAAGAVCTATRKVVAGEARRAFCAVRPPGHHALADRAMGFCLINHIAVAARMATDELNLDRVLIVDWDVHHGNGTQDLFYDDPRVGFFSAHRWPFYPGTGAADETGTGDGLGATHNLPVKMGTSRDRYLAWLARDLQTFADRIKPQLVLISAGFDSHRLDPIGSLGLETEDFADLTRVVLDIAATHADGRVISVLEGGYNPAVLADCVATHLEELIDRDEEEAGESC
ncbi:MAG: histone deacetylase [Planctomycetota bacterium]